MEMKISQALIEERWPEMLPVFAEKLAKSSSKERNRSIDDAEFIFYWGIRLNSYSIADIIAGRAKHNPEKEPEIVWSLGAKINRWTHYISMNQWGTNYPVPDEIRQEIQRRKEEAEEHRRLNPIALEEAVRQLRGHGGFAEIKIG